MKNKKMIEEIAEFIDEIDNNAYVSCLPWSEGVAKADGEKIAKELIKHYQPRLLKNIAITSKEELKEKYVPKSFYELAKKVHEDKVEELENLINYWIENWKQANKETAEKIYKFVDKFLRYDEENLIPNLANYLKELGVEIKE